MAQLAVPIYFPEWPHYPDFDSILGNASPVPRSRHNLGGIYTMAVCTDQPCGSSQPHHMRYLKTGPSLVDGVSGRKQPPSGGWQHYRPLRSTRRRHTGFNINTKGDHKDTVLHKVRASSGETVKHLLELYLPVGPLLR